VLVAMTDNAATEAEARAAVLDLSGELYRYFEPTGLTSYRGLPPRLAREVFQVPDAEGRLDALADPAAMTVPVTNVGIPTGREVALSGLRQEALPDLIALRRAAEAAGARYWVTEGYRPPQEADLPWMVHNPIMPTGCEVRIPATPVDEPLSASGAPAEPAIRPEGERAVDVPTAHGVSPTQHWLGTVFAFSDDPDRDAAALGAEPTGVSDWLTTHGWTYGFVPALPETEQGLRLRYEPWRLRWVGRELATQVQAAIGTPAYADQLRAVLQYAEEELELLEG